MTQIFNHALSELKNALDVSGYEGKRKYFPTFVSKLLHWTLPRAFPMRDGISVSFMREVAKKNMISFSPSYDGVVDFYVLLAKKLEASNGLDVKQKLEELDYESLPRGLKERYGWLRVIDKWLWLGGQSK